MSIQVCELLLVETSDTDNDADGMELQFSKHVSFLQLGRMLSIDYSL